MRTELYRHYDVNNNLLYVGISLSTAARLSTHKNTSAWFEKITTIRIERFATRQEAIEAEEKTIRNEKPLYNRLMNENGVKLPKLRKSILSGLEVCKRIDIDPKTLRKRVKENTFPVPPIPGTKPPKWRAVDVDTFVAGSADK